MNWLDCELLSSSIAYEVHKKRRRRAELHKEVKVFIGSFPLKHYEKLPKYASITGVLSFPLNEKYLNKNCLAP